MCRINTNYTGRLVTIVSYLKNTNHEFPIKTTDANGSVVNMIMERFVVDRVDDGTHYGSRISGDPIQQRFYPSYVIHSRLGSVAKIPRTKIGKKARTVRVETRFNIACYNDTPGFGNVYVPALSGDHLPGVGRTHQNSRGVTIV